MFFLKNQQEKYFKKLFDKATIPAGLVDKQKRLLSANDTFYRAYPHIKLGDPLKDSPLFSLDAHYGLVLPEEGPAKKSSAETEEQKKNRAIGQIASGVAHDFNNMLTIIDGYCESLLDRHPIGDPSFIELNQIKQICQRASKTVMQMLSFAREQRLQLYPVSPGTVLNDMRDILQRACGTKNALKLYHKSDPGMVIGDENQLHQAILNLTLNARDAVSKKGEISITIEEKILDKPLTCRAETIEAGRYGCISICDNGKGIPPSLREQIFEPFFTTKPETEGNGMGLSTVDGFARQCGGALILENNRPKGTCFRIYLPCKEVTSSQPSSTKGTAKEKKTHKDHYKILLAEDEDAIRLFLARGLRGRGYEVIESRDGANALALWPEEKPDLLITDMIMPHKNGAELIRAVRDDFPICPVICLSGYVRDEVFKPIEAYENLHFIAKPFDMRALLQLVSTLLPIAA